LQFEAVFKIQEIQQRYKQLANRWHTPTPCSSSMV
jgi:hypothetical protein